MDLTQAKFILHSFRPDGADVNDHDFAEALAMAIEHRELGEWLATERAFDASFANALTSLAMPETLRQDIIGCMAGERGDFPQADEPLGASLIGAFAMIKPPASLRNGIVAAMMRTTPKARFTKPKWQRIAFPLAAAAGIALAFLFTLKNDRPQAVASQEPLPADIVQAGFIRAYESPLFSLDKKHASNPALISYLKSRKLPCPGELPKGLANITGIGCREIVIDGKRGSLICFDERENGVVHLVIFRREDISGDLPNCERPSFSQTGRWAAARWEDGNKAFFLIGNTNIQKLATIF